MRDKSGEWVQQDPPFTIKVEMSEGCCLYCDFCGIRGIRSGPGNYKFMSVDHAEQLAMQIAMAKWTSKIEFTMHGEPTMNPNCADIIKVFRTYLPYTQLMITSNGGGLQREDKLKNIFANGLNILALDDYDDANFVPTVLQHGENLGIAIHEYPVQKKYTPHTRVNVKKHEHYIVIIKDIGVTGKVGTRKLSNHCGAAGPLDHSVTSRCARPFRELVVRYDLQVPICCNDWRSEYVCGDLRETNIEQVWQEVPFDAAREMLYHKRREFRPCAGCNSVSYRVGLLPDKLGKCLMLEPDEATIFDIEDAVAKGPLTTPVPRSWEVKGSLRDRLKKRSKK